jgi:hypothetical protein
VLWCNKAILILAADVFSMMAAWLCMGRLCEWVCRGEGGANDEEEWSCIDAPKGGKGGKA